jgi:hypothetical protein
MRTRATRSPKKPRRYGWNRDGTRNAEQQDVIHEIILRTRHGHTAGAIAADLNARWVSSRRPGGKWYPSTVRAVLLAHVGRRRPRAGKPSTADEQLVSDP